MSVKEFQTRISTKFTEKTLVDLLEKTSKLQNISIKKINVSDSSKKGDSYLSRVCRFNVDATGINERGEQVNYSLPVIAKGIPSNVARRKTFRSSDFFATEIYFYSKVWPVMKDFKDEKSVKDFDYEVTDMLASYSDGENDFIVMEDLSYRNYRNADKSFGVDLAHTKLIINIMAKFHALSLALKMENPEFKKLASGLEESYFSEKFRNWYAGFLKANYKYYEHAIKTELAQEYLDQFNKAFSTDIFGIACKLCEVKNKFSVVTQGDAWLPNFLIKYDEQKTPINSIIIDFQLARYTSLSNDLIFFLYACVPEEIIKNNWNDLIMYYHTVLSKRMGELGADWNYITLEELKEDLKKQGFFGFCMGMEAITMSLFEEDEVADLDEIQGIDAVPLEKIMLGAYTHYPDKKRNQKLAFFIKHLIDNGFLDHHA